MTDNQIAVIFVIGVGLGVTALIYLIEWKKRNNRNNGSSVS